MDITQDGPDTLPNIDPPHMAEVQTDKSTFDYEMTFAQHQQLLIRLAVVKGKFLLSGYFSELFDSVAKIEGRVRHEKQIDNKSSSKKTKDIRVECLWANFSTK